MTHAVLYLAGQN